MLVYIYWQVYITCGYAGKRKQTLLFIKLFRLYMCYIHIHCIIYIQRRTWDIAVIFHKCTSISAQIQKEDSFTAENEILKKCN